jgi:hypothetical protein
MYATGPPQAVHVHAPYDRKCPATCAWGTSAVCYLTATGLPWRPGGTRVQMDNASCACQRAMQDPRQPWRMAVSVEHSTTRHHPGAVGGVVPGVTGRLQGRVASSAHSVGRPICWRWRRGVRLRGTHASVLRCLDPRLHYSGSEYTVSSGSSVGLSKSIR